MGRDLDALFTPASIAVVGASSDRDKVGGQLLHHLKAHGYTGRVYPVNPRYRDVAGWPCYPSLDDVPEAPDLVLLPVPAEAVGEQVLRAGRRGARFAVVYAAGFAEVGLTGAAAQKDLWQRARAWGLRVVGPNCQGFINFHRRIVCNWSSAFEASPLVPGPVAFASQSGAMIGFTYPEALRLGMGFSYVVSTGNEADVDVFECITWLADDPETRVIMAYLEEIRHIDRFWRAVAATRAAGKPLVVLKAGRTARGAVAAASHTGALAGDDRRYDALFRRAGVIRVNDVEELLTTADLLARDRWPTGPRLGILVNSGGMGVLLVDEAVARGLEVPALGEATKARLRAHLPPFAAVDNPVDAIQAFRQIEHLDGLLTALREAPEVDVVVLFVGMAQMGTAYPLSLMVRTLGRWGDNTAKPLLVVWMGGSSEVVDALRRLRVPVFTNPTTAIKALTHLYAAARGRARADAEPRGDPGVVEAEGLTAGWFSAARTLAWLADHGIPVVPGVRVAHPAEAPAAAASLGFPVAVKVDTSSLLHKSDVGGVALGVTADAVRNVAERLYARAREEAGAADVGLLVQAMAAPGVELLVGVVADARLGPFVLVGSGGLMTEWLDDVVLEPAPVTAAQAAAMLQQLKSYPVLAGVRGHAPADVDAVAQVVATLSELAGRRTADGLVLTELDINPLVVYPAGQGCLALDARMRWVAPEAGAHGAG